VVGRGLRRTSYDLDPGSELFAPEYVNIFGIPFKYLPHESEDDGTPKTEKPKTQIEVVPEKSEYQISWPNIIRLDRMMKPVLSVDMTKIAPLVLDADKTIKIVELAPVLEGKPDFTRITEINLERLDSELRFQQVVFDAAAETFRLMQASWQGGGTTYALFGQVVRLVEKFLSSGKVHIHPPLFNTTPLRQRIMWKLHMTPIVRHLWDYIQIEQTEKVVPIFDLSKPIRSTADMPTWYTGKQCQVTRKSHISHCTFDSSWEATEQGALERNEHVLAWAKNDHLGFEVAYSFDGVFRKYRPDFLIRLDNGKTLVLEVKGRESRQDIQKRKALVEWVDAVNELGEYGTWCNDVSYNVSDVDGVIEKWR